MLGMITQAEIHQYRDHERNHGHPYEHPQVGWTIVVIHGRGSALKGSM
jgi:hypothetical protein